jgi:hypothetical protein
MIGYSFGIGGRASGNFAASLALSAWWRMVDPGDYNGAGTWAGRASLGTSGKNPAIDLSTFPSKSGNNVVFNSTDDFLTGSGKLFATYFGVAAYSGWALIYVNAVDTDDAAPYNNVAIASSDPSDSSRFSVYLRSSGLVGLHHYDGSDHKTVITEIEFGVWQLVQWRFNGTHIQIRVNDGAWQSTAASSIVYSIDPDIRLGRSYFNTEYFDGSMRDVALSGVCFDDATFERVRAQLSTEYGVVLDNDYPTPFLWLRADVGITKDGSNNVGAWDSIVGPDSIPNSNPPLWISSDAGFNNKPVVSFNSQYMFGTFTSAIPAGSPFTIIIAADITSGAVLDSNDSNRAAILALGGGNVAMYLNDGSTNLDSGVTAGGTQVIAATFAPIPGTNSIAVDQGTPQASTTTEGSDGFATIILGASTGAGSVGVVKLAEVRVFDKYLDYSERLAVMRKMGTRYSVSVGA